MVDLEVGSLELVAEKNAEVRVKPIRVVEVVYLRV